MALRVAPLRVLFKAPNIPKVTLNPSYLNAERLGKGAVALLKMCPFRT